MKDGCPHGWLSLVAIVVEFADCLCNIAAMVDLACKNRELAAQAYGIITLIDCASLAIPGIDLPLDVVVAAIQNSILNYDDTIPFLDQGINPTPQSGIEACVSLLLEFVQAAGKK